jgi:hypothetical protein
MKAVDITAWHSSSVTRGDCRLMRRLAGRGGIAAKRRASAAIVAAISICGAPGARLYADPSVEGEGVGVRFSGVAGAVLVDARHANSVVTCKDTDGTHQNH